MSFSRTGPFTLRMIVRLASSMNSTRTCVTPPREPVRPRTYNNVERHRTVNTRRDGVEDMSYEP